MSQRLEFWIPLTPARRIFEGGGEALVRMEIYVSDDPRRWLASPAPSGSR